MDGNKKTGPYGTVKEWIEILKNVKALSQKAEEIAKRNDPKWYFSDEGKNAYEAADTPAKKTKFFFDYLMAKKDKTVNAKESTDIFFKTALVMASAIDKSSLEYGSYPDILDENKNPILNDVIIMNKKMIDALAEDPHLLSSYLLSSLHGKELTVYSQNNAYKNLSFCKDGEEFSDLYKLERAIIGICCSNSATIVPYDSYNLSFESDEDEEDIEESEDEN